MTLSNNHELQEKFCFA